MIPGANEAGFCRAGKSAVHLKKYPNLVFVDPSISVNHLLHRAKALVTLGGTLTVKTLILGCPVAYVSRSRFGQFGLGQITENFINFASALAVAATQTTDESDLVHMLAGIHRHCHRFAFVEPLGHAATFTDDNIEKIATAVVERIDGFARG